MPCERELKHLLNLVNAVTAPHRHGQSVSKRRLDDLANAQVEYEEAMSACDESPWRSMESAPQDQSILVFGRSRRAPFAYVARYRAYESGAVEWLDSAGMCRDTNQITHWMPMPAAPEVGNV